MLTNQSSVPRHTKTFKVVNSGLLLTNNIAITSISTAKNRFVQHSLEGLSKACFCSAACAPRAPDQIPHLQRVVLVPSFSPKRVAPILPVSEDDYHYDIN